MPVCLLLAVSLPALAAPDPGDQHRLNWARADRGAKLVAAPEAHPATGIEPLLNVPVNGSRHQHGHVILADKPQHERLVIDLGQERSVGRVFISSNPHDAPRHPDAVTIRGSTDGPEGPWQTLLDAGDMGTQHTFLFENTPVRYVELDFGQTSHDRGTRISCLGVFTRYRCPEADVVAQWLAELLDRKAEGLDRFFQAADAGDWDAAVTALRDHYAAQHEPRPPGVSERSRGITDDMLAHRFQFGDPAHTFGPRVEDIDWAFELDYEWTNSLNRCGFWSHAANAYEGTGDAEIIREIEAQLLHWIESCPLPPPSEDGRHRSWQTWDCPAQITWRSLDSGIRLWKLCDLLPRLCADREHVSDRACMNLLYSLWEHMDYLSDDDWDGGNWLSTVNSSVLDAAVALPEFRDSPGWLEYSKKAFETNVLRDVRPDGKEIENSPGYISFAYGSMFSVLETLTERGVAVDPEARRRLDLLEDFLAWVAFPDGTFPMIGDCDRGGIGLLERTWPFFEREDIRYIVTRGKEGAQPTGASRYWEDSGWAVMRSAWEAKRFGDARHLVFKASPRGPHGHLDQLSVTLYAHDKALLIDPGRCNYRAEGRIFRSTPYHNTVTVDGADQPDGDAAFERWESTDTYDLAVGSHSLYPGATHRRTVLFAKPHFWLVRDDLASEQEHEYVQRWHLPEDARPMKQPAGGVTTRFGKGANLLIVPLSEVAASGPEDYEIAYRWDERVPATAWNYTLAGDSLAVLLIPYRGKRPPAVRVESAQLLADSTDVVLRMGGRRWRIKVGPGDEVEVSRS